MKKVFILIFLCFSQILLAQKEANIWYFGDKAGLDFNSGTPVVLLDSQMYAEGGCASISDTNGNLLFYTNGRTVWNKNHLVMLNGTSLNGGSRSTHSAIVVPKPNNVSKYYIFTVGDFVDSTGLQYSEVDMTLDGGLGGVTSIKNIPLHTPTTEKITAIKSATANEYWIVSHKYGNDEFIAYNVSDLGVNTTPVISAVGTVVDNDGSSIGQIKISPDGKKIAVARYPSISEVQLFDFDASTGIVSNPVTLLKYSDDSLIYGVEFSPNSQLLYTGVLFQDIYQFNLNAGSSSDIINSKTSIYSNEQGHYDSFQIAPDGKIYIAGFAENYLDIIHQPNIVGLGCDFEFEALYLEGKLSFSGLPVFIQSFFTINFQSKNHCLGDTTSFKISNTQTYDSVLWNFGDGTTSNQESPTHTYRQTGTYSVTLTVTSGINVSVETQEVTIYKIPLATQPTDMVICDDDNDGFYNFNLTAQTNTIFNGQSSSKFEIDYFDNQTDYDNNTPITDDTSYKNTTAYEEQTIIARVRNKENLDCEVTTSFKIKIFESPTPSTDIPNLSFCDITSVGTDTDGKILFNLKDRETEILNSQSTADFEVTYFEDENLTQAVTNQTSYPNLVSPQRIYAKVQNRENSSCYAKTSFLIEVFELPVINPVVSLKQCDNNDINGFSAFNLNEAKSKIVASPDDYTIIFFEEKSLAESNTSPIPNPTNYTNEVVSTDTVWARVENNNSCFRVSEVNLIVSTTQIPVNFLKTFYECDDGTSLTDGIATFDFSLVTEEVKKLFPPNQQLSINYYRNEADALSELNKITDITNYKNIGYPNQQDIYVRVDSQLDNDCLGLGHHITLNVEKIPIANPVAIIPQCDNDRDGLYTFDTTNIQSIVIGNQTNVGVSYFDENGAQLPTPLPNPFVTASQNIIARVTNINSQDLDGQCYAETSIAFVVNSVPIANAIAPQELCDEDTDGIVAFDTSIVESTILGNQTGLIVKYFDANGDALPSPLPNPFYTESQTVTVRLENPQYRVCYEETTVSFIVRTKPEVQLDEEAIICMTGNPHLQVSVDNPNSNYTYSWTDENNSTISNSSTADLVKGGVYTVVASSEYGCKSDTKYITVEESSISSITINYLEIIDDSENNSIEINTQNIGLGDYEFSLLDTDSNSIYDYQKTPFFDNLEGGIYTVLIKDKNGCGIQSFETSIISYPKFFTPNNDGINDVWTLKGISKNNYKSATIRIFNRYGKIIAQASIDDKGWDGSYNGKPLPSNDYWFYIELIGVNGTKRSKKGNFSLIRK